MEETKTRKGGGGTKAGAAKAVKTIKKRYGPDFFKQIGHTGGSASGTGGFFNNPDLARRAGALGGRKSKRGPSKKNLPSVDEFAEGWG